MQPAAMTLASLLADIGTVFTNIVTWLGNMVTFVAQNPLLLIFAIIGLAGIVMRIARSWIPGV